MKLNDIYNMEHYLSDDCYCKGEIYDVTGFFFMVFDKEDECKKIGEKEEDGMKTVGVICRNQIVNFWSKDNKIVDAERVDATENNIKIEKMFLKRENIDRMNLDEFEKGSTEKSLKEVLNIADAITT